MAQFTMKVCSSCVPERKTFLQMTHYFDISINITADTNTIILKSTQ